MPKSFTWIFIMMIQQLLENAEGAIPCLTYTNESGGVVDVSTSAFSPIVVNSDSVVTLLNCATRVRFEINTLQYNGSVRNVTFFVVGGSALPIIEILVTPSGSGDVEHISLLVSNVVTMITGNEEATRPLFFTSISSASPLALQNIHVSISNSTIDMNATDASFIAIGAVQRTTNVQIDICNSHISMLTQLVRQLRGRLIEISPEHGVSEFVTISVKDSFLRNTVHGCVKPGGSFVGDFVVLCATGDPRNQTDNSVASLIQFSGVSSQYRDVNIYFSTTEIDNYVISAIPSLFAIAVVVYFHSYERSNVTVARANFTIIDSPHVNITANYRASLLVVDNFVNVDVFTVDIVRSHITATLAPIQAVFKAIVLNCIIDFATLNFTSRVKIKVEMVRVRSVADRTVAVASSGSEILMALIRQQSSGPLSQLNITVANSNIELTHNNASSTATIVAGGFYSLNVFATTAAVVTLASLNSSAATLDQSSIVINTVRVIATTRLISIGKMINSMTINLSSFPVQHTLVTSTMAKAFRSIVEISSSSLHSVVEVLPSSGTMTTQVDASNVYVLTTLALLGNPHPIGIQQLRSAVSSTVFSSLPQLLPTATPITINAFQLTLRHLSLEVSCVVPVAATSPVHLISMFVVPNNMTNSTFTSDSVICQQSNQHPASIMWEIHAFLCVIDCHFVTTTKIIVKSCVGLRGPLALVSAVSSDSATPLMTLASTIVYLVNISHSSPPSSGVEGAAVIWDRSQRIEVSGSTLWVDGCTFTGYQGLLVSRNVTWRQQQQEAASAASPAGSTLVLKCNVVTPLSNPTTATNFTALTPKSIERAINGGGAAAQFVTIDYPINTPMHSSYLPQAYPMCLPWLLTTTATYLAPEEEVVSPSTAPAGAAAAADATLTTIFSVSLAVELLSSVIIGGDGGSSIGDAQMLVMIGQSVCAPAPLKASTTTIKKVIISPFSLLGDAEVVLGNGALVALCIVIIHVYTRWKLRHQPMMRLTRENDAATSHHKEGGHQPKILVILQEPLAKMVNWSIVASMFLIVGVVNSIPKLCSSSESINGGAPDPSTITAGIASSNVALRWCVALFGIGIAVAAGHLYVYLHRKCEPHFLYRPYTQREFRSGLYFQFIQRSTDELQQREILPHGFWRPQHMKTAFGKLRGTVRGGEQAFAMYPIILTLSTGLISGVPATSSTWCFGMLPLISVISLLGAVMIVTCRPNRCRLAGTLHAMALVGTALTAALCTAALQNDDEDNERNSTTNWASSALPIVSIILSLIGALRTFHTVIAMLFERNIRSTAGERPKSDASPQLSKPFQQDMQRTNDRPLELIQIIVSTAGESPTSDASARFRDQEMQLYKLIQIICGNATSLKTRLAINRRKKT